MTAKHPGAIVDRAVLESELDLIDEETLVFFSFVTTPPVENDAMIAEACERLQREEAFSLAALLAETEKNYIESALRLTHGNVSQAARLLGINRTTLYNRMESLAKEQ